MGGSVLDFRGGETCARRGVGKMVQGVGINLRDTSAQEGADQEFEAFKFGLEDDEAKIGFWVRVACLIFYELDLVRIVILASARIPNDLEGVSPDFVPSQVHVPLKRRAMARSLARFVLSPMLG